MTLAGASKTHYHLVALAYGADAATVERYTDWSRDVTYDSETWASVPSLALTLPPNTGGLEEQALVVEFPDGLASALLQALAAGEPTSPVYVTVIHASLPLAGESGDPDYLVTCDRFEVAKASRRRGLVRLEAVSVKADLRVQLGLAATVECQWTLFGRGCGLDRAAHAETVTLAGIDSDDGKQVTLTGHSHPATAPGGTPGKFWDGGYLEREGLKIAIREWSASNPSVFQLRRRPPASWEGEEALLVPGCDKSIETCRARWDNEEHFAGSGFAVPDHHTVYEEPR